MKKAFLTLILSTIVLCLASCCSTEPEQAVYNVFFSEDLLAEYDLDDMPVPSLDDSVIYGEDVNVLYLNLTKEEFNAYIEELSSYILSRDDIYNKGVWYTSDIAVGPLFIPLTIDVYIPFEDNTDLLANGNKLAFSKEEDLSSGWVLGLMSDAYEIDIQYENGIIHEIDFEYNTVIKIGKAEYARFDTCAKEHKYGEPITYPIPGLEAVIDVYQCIYCGSKTQSYYYGGNDYNAYATVIVKGSEYLESECYRTFSVNPTCYAGLIEQIIIPESDDATYSVTVNGFEIPMTYKEDNCLVYGFIMPDCDVEIAITKNIE